jgi:protein-disulfide isomerase
MHKYKAIIWGAIFMGAVAIGLVFVVIYSRNHQNQPASLGNIVLKNEQIKGNQSAPVTLVEYSDFQCPACGAFYPVVKRLLEEYGDKIKFIYRHFPLRQIHANADLAARAAEAAGQQGKFWEMHDLIFENQKNWSGAKNAETLFTEYAGYLNLNVEQFKTDLQAEGIVQKVKKDYESGIASGVNATPTFFLNGKKIENLRSYEELRNIVIQAVAEEQ